VKRQKQSKTTTTTTKEKKPLKTFTTEEVSKHNQREDLWVIIDGNVYNVTDFAEEHPGGDVPLMENAGRDASDPFKDVGHTDGAMELLTEYHIGVIEGYSAKPPVESSEPRAESKYKKEGNEKTENTTTAPTALKKSSESTSSSTPKGTTTEKTTLKTSSGKSSTQSVKPPSSNYGLLLIPIVIIALALLFKFYVAE